MPFELPAEFAEALRAYRRERADELTTLADLLFKYDLLSDVGPLYAAADGLRGAIKPTPKDGPDPDRWYWGYFVDELRLSLAHDWKSLPKAAVLETSALTISVQEYVPGGVAELEHPYENLRLADVDFTLAGFCDHSDGTGAVHAAWHVDTHRHPESTTLAHPKHHLQFGGNKLEEIDDKVRALWIPDTPRIAVFPLDAVLAVDFVLSHYAGAGWAKIQLNEQYQQLRRTAATRYWRPVAETIASYFVLNRKQAEGHAAVRLLPSLAWS